MSKGTRVLITAALSEKAKASGRAFVSPGQGVVGPVRVVLDVGLAALGSWLKRPKGCQAGACGCVAQSERSRRMNCEQLRQNMICLPLIALLALSIGCGAIQTLFATPTRAGASPQPGEWTASAESLGTFAFRVSPDSTTVTLVSFHFKQFYCGSSAADERWLHGDWWPDTTITGTITDRQFTLSPQVSGRYVLTFGGLRPSFDFLDEIAISGEFDETGTRANGTWGAAWAGTVCAGNWESAERGVPPAASQTTTTPVAPVRLGSGLTDSFDNNSNEWFVDDYHDQFVAGSRSITDGTYRWEVQAYQPSRFSSVPEVDPVSDFYLIVDAKRVSGTRRGMYGLLFRRLDRNNCYLFQINDDQFFTFELLDQDRYTTLIDWTKTSAIHPGEVNQLAVRGEGSHFEFFINGEFVGEADDSEFSSGIVGLVIGFPNAGDSAVFEFDNFELGTQPPAR
jgi:hypothetical protein